LKHTRTPWLVLISFVLALVAAALPAAAGDVGSEGKPVKLRGFITDEWCGKANANPKGAECARACAKKGSDMAIWADDRLYKLSDKELALKHLGYEVEVTGTLEPDGSVKVEAIRKVEAEPDGAA